MIEVKKFARNKLQKMKRKEQHYSFRKVNTGLASVLLGFTLGGLAITFTPGKVAASDNNSAQVATTQQTSSNSTAEQTNNTSSTAESTQVKTQVSYTGSNQNPATQETKTTFSGKKTGDSSYD
ncbi:YSIRK-type signal peptide-containing protein [Lactobacillus delbrueckii]